MILKFQWLACVAMLLGATFTSTCNAGLIFSFATNEVRFLLLQAERCNAGIVSTSVAVDIDGLAFWDEGGDGLSYDSNRLGWLTHKLCCGPLWSTFFNVDTVCTRALEAGELVQYQPCLTAGLRDWCWYSLCKYRSNLDWYTIVSAVTGASYVEARAEQG